MDTTLDGVARDVAEADRDATEADAMTVAEPDSDGFADAVSVADAVEEREIATDATTDAVDAADAVAESVGLAENCTVKDFEKNVRVEDADLGPEGLEAADAEERVLRDDATDADAARDAALRADDDARADCEGADLRDGAAERDCDAELVADVEEQGDAEGDPEVDTECDSLPDAVSLLDAEELRVRDGLRVADTEPEGVRSGDRDRVRDDAALLVGATTVRVGEGSTVGGTPRSARHCARMLAS